MNTQNTNTNTNEVAVTTENKTALRMTDKQALALVEKIDKNYATVEKGYLSMCGSVAKAHDYKVHKQLEYGDFYVMCEERWGMKSTSVKNLLAIFERFGDKDNYTITQKWLSYGLSKLTAIKDLTDGEIEQLGIDPTMTRGDITDIVKRFKGIEDKKNSKPEESTAVEENVENDGTDASDNSEIEVKAIEVLKLNQEQFLLLADFLSQFDVTINVDSVYRLEVE